MNAFRIQCIALIFGVAAFSLAQDQVSSPPILDGKDSAQKSAQDDLGKLGLEDLMNVKVGGGTMPLRDLKDVTAAVYVLSSEDIRKSGATNVPDMLRLVPGVSVAQVDANIWMISIRGFSSQYANKLQVLIDGRSIYSPAFSGVFWDQIGLTPDEIERIEVIRGSDGSLWGSNAVNGIINIVTKNSADTQGGFYQEGFSTHNAGDHYVRFGGSHGDDTFRFSARSTRFGQSQANTYPTKDSTESNWFNFRSDHKFSDTKSLSVTSSYYSARLGQSTTIPTLANPNQIVDTKLPVSDFNVSASLVSQQSKKEVSEFKLSYTRSDRKQPEFGIGLSSLDLGYNRSSKIDENRSAFYGASFRQVELVATDSPLLTATPSASKPMTFSAYGQFEMDLGPKTQFTIGSTLENNPYSGLEFQPSARLLFRKSPTESQWISLSRAVRTPSPAETMANLLLAQSIDPNTGLPIIVVGQANSNFKSESVVSAEAGWRKQVNEKVLIDTTTFYNSYTNLRSYEFLSNQVVSGPPTYIDSMYIVRNERRANTYGIETNVNARMSDDWNLTGNISYMDDHFWLAPGSTNPLPITGTDGSGSVPKWQANLRSSWNLSDATDFSLSGYYVGANKVYGLASYTRLDGKLEFRLSDNGTLSLTGQNLLSPSHLEGASSFNEIPAQVRRTILLQLSYKF